MPRTHSEDHDTSDLRQERAARPLDELFASAPPFRRASHRTYQVYLDYDNGNTQIPVQCIRAVAHYDISDKA